MLTQEERDARLAVINDELTRLDKFQTLTAAQTATRTKLLTERETLTRETAESYLAVRRAQVLDVARRSGQIETGTDTGRPADARSSKGFTGDPWSSPAGESLAGARPGAIRSQAVTAVERVTTMPDPVREMVTRDLEADDDPQSRMARAVVELSQPAYRSAFLRWLADPERGSFEWSPEERAAVRRVGTVSRALELSGSGGYLAPFELDPAVMISSAGQIDPMRAVARVVRTAVNEKRFVTSDGVSSGWYEESAEVADDTPTLVNPPVVCHKGMSFVPYSFEQGEDVDLVPMLSALFADAKAELEADAFTNGAGTDSPMGVVRRVKQTGVVDTSSNALAADDPMTLQAAVPPRWRSRSRFMAALPVLNGFRVLAKSATLTESVVDDTVSGRPRMYGWEVSENSSMDATLGAGDDFLLLAGDFQNYVVLDRLGTTIEYVPVLFGAAHRPNGQRGLLMHWRVGGDAILPNAFRILNYSV